MSLAELTVAIIGAGPRGLSVLERLVALESRFPPGGAHPRRTLRIVLIDPHPPGAGAVWRTDQPECLLMNTTLAEQTVFPDASCRISPLGDGPTMAEWAAAEAPARGSETAPSAALAEAASAPSAVFPSRADYGRYLRWAYERICASAPAHVRIVWEAHRATTLADSAPEDAESGQIIGLDDGHTLRADDVVLCLGHIPAELSEERGEWAALAAQSGLPYLPPELPADTPLERIDPGTPVLVRGFGLNWFDIQTLLTVGRGGRFAPAAGDGHGGAAEHGGELAYTPGGEEPVLMPGSRRGVPYRAKPITHDHPLAVPQATELRFLTGEAIERLATTSGRDSLRFDGQLWPLILADLRLAWYTALAAGRPEAFAGDAAAGLATLEDALVHGVEEHLTGRARASHSADGSQAGADDRLTGSPLWRQLEDTVLAPAPTGPGAEHIPHRLDLGALLRPLSGRHFADEAEYRDWMLDYLRADYEAAMAGPELAPTKAIFPVLWTARSMLKELVADGRIDTTSFIAEIRGWFEDFAAGICDGAPPQRYAELIALAEAGIVRFAGPDLRIDVSRADEPPAFFGVSPVREAPLRARALIDASSPANRVRRAADGLLSGMLVSGAARAAAHVLRDGTEVASTGLDVSGPSHRLVDAAGSAHPHRRVLSVQLSAVQLGLAIAANPGAGARPLRDAHIIACEILGLG